MAILFGSVARGDETADSDLDVLVDLRDPDRFRMLELEERLTRTLGRSVQLLRLSDARREGTILGDVLADGRVIVDRDSRWPAFTKQSDQIHRIGEQELDARARQSLVAHLEDFPRQLEALRFSTQTFGGDFDAAQFADAFESEEPELYTRVQAIERGFGRLQNYIALMAEDGTKLAELPRRGFEANEPRAQPAFEALRDARVITKDLCRRLIATQKIRTLFEHDYVQVAAEDVHAAVVQLLGVAPAFLERFSVWIEPYLLTRSPDQAAE